MRENFLDQLAPFALLKSLIETQDPPASFQTIPRHLQFVHRMHILYMHLETWSIRRFRRPHVQIFVSPCFEIQRVVAVVQIRKLGKKM
jgi:hypothetical protein